MTTGRRRWAATVSVMLGASMVLAACGGAPSVPGASGSGGGSASAGSGSASAASGSASAGSGSASSSSGASAGSGSATSSSGASASASASGSAGGSAATSSAGSGSAPTTAAGGDLPVGVPVPFTGQYSWVGQYVMQAANPMVKQINASGGIFGRKIKLITGDTEGTVDAGVLAARKLAETDQVLAFVGPTSLSFTGVRQVITDTKTPMISPTAGTTELDTAAKSLFFRTVPSDSLGGRAIAVALSDPGKYLGSSTKYSNIALMVGNAPALVSFEKPIQEGLKANGLHLVGTTEYTTGQQSYRSEVSKVLGQSPDMIILIGEPADSAKIMKQAHQNGYTGGWFVTQDQTNSDYVKLATPAVADGIYGLQEAEPESAADLRTKFEKQLGEKDLQIFQANTYDAVNVLALAMYAAQKEDGSITRATIEKHIDEVANPESGDVVVTSFAAGKKAMEQGKGIDYQGLAGPVDFDAYGNITSPFNIMQVKSGAFAVAGTVTGQDLT